jgi:hypothetical protein
VKRGYDDGGKNNESRWGTEAGGYEDYCKGRCFKLGFRETQDGLVEKGREGGRWVRVRRGKGGILGEWHGLDGNMLRGGKDVWGKGGQGAVWEREMKEGGRG